jgi:hypothetical protein
MAEGEDNNVKELKGGSNKVTGKSLLESVLNDQNKARAEAAKARLKEAVKKKVDLDKAMTLASQEVDQIVADFDAGK